MSLTDDPNDPRLKRGVDNVPGPQNEVYLVLSPTEREKGFVRPLRRSYVHVGEKFCGKPHQSERHGELFCTDKPGHEGECTVYTDAAHFAARQKGCGTVTTMGLALCETYARNPAFYSSTYCAGCQMHKAVAEFTWSEDGAVVGS